MIKRFPGRNHRSKGIKVKHVLQIILLLGVCFWLIYQVKHNHDKKKEFAKDAKLLASTQTDPILKLGRKDLHPGKREESQNEKREEEEEDEHIEDDEENKHDHKEQEDGSKHETEERGDNKDEGREQGEEEKKLIAQEQEEDENKNEDVEDDGRGGGDDEIDENDQDKTEVDTIDRDDEFLDEEKEKEKEEEVDEKEKENENEDEEKEGLVEDHNNHEAREEHYKGDDASSAVAHDTHSSSTETETLSLENSDVNLEANITKPENETTYSDENVGKQNDSDLKVSEGDAIDKISSNATTEAAGNKTLSNPVDDSSYLNKTTPTSSDSHLESSSNLTVVTTEASNNVTGAGNDTSSSSELNKTVMLSESDQAQNTTTNTTVSGDVKNVQTEVLEQNGNTISEENQLNTDSTTDSVKTENGGAAAGESSNLVASNVTDNTNRNERSESETSEGDNSKVNTEMSETNETQNVDATEEEMFKGVTQTGENDETSDSSSTNETLDSAEQDAIDSDDTHIHEDVAEARTDLDTLPDIRNEGDDSDETAAE